MLMRALHRRLLTTDNIDIDKSDGKKKGHPQFNSNNKRINENWGRQSIVIYEFFDINRWFSPAWHWRIRLSSFGSLHSVLLCIFVTPCTHLFTQQTSSRLCVLGVAWVGHCYSVYSEPFALLYPIVFPAPGLAYQHRPIIIRCDVIESLLFWRQRHPQITIIDQYTIRHPPLHILFLPFN